MKRILATLILGLFLPCFAMAQTRHLTGKVIDDKGAGVAEATVSLKGTSIVTITRANGDFELTVPSNLPDAEIIVTHINYREQTVKVTGNEVTISLVTNQQQLSEVVVIGYGTQKKRNVTGAVASLNTDFE